MAETKRAHLSKMLLSLLIISIVAVIFLIIIARLILNIKGDLQNIMSLQDDLNVAVESVTVAVAKLKTAVEGYVAEHGGTLDVSGLKTLADTVDSITNELAPTPPVAPEAQEPAANENDAVVN